jgi:hypothetical protein
MLFLAVSFVWGRGLATLLLFLYVTEEAGRKMCTGYMPWPLAAECNMITNKQKSTVIGYDELHSTLMSRSAGYCRTQATTTIYHSSQQDALLSGCSHDSPSYLDTSRSPS